MSCEMPAKRNWHTLIEEYSQAAGSFNARVTWSSTLSICHRCTPGNQARNWSMVAPFLRFSKSVAMGTREPENTHVPLTFCWFLTTAEHASQLIMGSPLRKLR